MFENPDDVLTGSSLKLRLIPAPIWKLSAVQTEL
jgi:hypothetical protein